MNKPKKYATWSVGGVKADGSEIGGEYCTEEDARIRFDLLLPVCASIVLYGWTGEGNRDEIKTWSK